MKRAFLIIATLFMMVSLKAQDNKDFYRFDKINNTLEFDITHYNLFEQRMHVVYSLSNDERFDITLGKKDGHFVLTQKEGIGKVNVERSFNEFCEEESAAFNNLSKEEAGEMFTECKEKLPSNFVASLMMDMYVKDRQNNLCANSDPFCTDVGVYQFPAGVNAGSGESGPNYDCLGTKPNPAWYYMRMANPGSMTIHMYSTPSYDIDFCCWGPFDDPISPCPNGLTGDKVVSCSYSTSATENCQIPSNAQTGQYYILIITNFSNQQCNITFSKTAGNGTTDCSILEPFLTANTPCIGNSLVLEADVIQGATYTWTSPDNQTHNGRTWTRSNATLNMAGTYTCHVSAGTQSGDESIDAVVLPNVTANFTYSEATVGDPVQFTGTETTNPTGHTSQINVREWDFGDGTTSTSTNPTHAYSNPGTYQVSYYVAITGGNDGECGDTETKTIQITNAFSANVTSDDTSFCDGDATPNLTATASGGYGNYTYSWTSNPTCVIDYPNSANTTAHPQIGTTTFSCTISDGHTTETKSVSVTVNAIPDVTITGPNPPHINYGATTTLSVPELSGATYVWSSEPEGLIASGQGTHQIQTANLVEPTTFYVTVSKNDCSDSNSFILAVGDALYASIEITGPDEICAGETSSLKANPSGGTLQYTYNWQPENMIEGSNTTQEINTSALNSDETFTCTITDTDNHTYTATSSVIKVNEIPEANAYVEANGTTYKTYKILAGNQVLLSMNEISGATYSWEPANMINTFIGDNHRVARTTTLSETGEIVFTSTVTTSSGCSNQDDLTIIVYESMDNCSISASSAAICDGFAVTLTANPAGGTGNYSYHWIPEEYYSDPYSQSTTVYPSLINNEYTCQITDTDIDDHTNNRIEKQISISILDKPEVNEALISPENPVIPGIDYMPYIYEYNILVSSLHGHGIEDAEYKWELYSYYDTPNHVEGTDHESTWQVFPDESDKNKAYVSINEEGNALLRCIITTDCGTTYSEQFIYTEGYEEGVSVNEIGYDSMISVFPNPSTGDLYISYKDIMVSTPITIKIYSHNGELIDKIYGNTNDNITHYSMDNMANGLYIISITGNDFVITKKFVLNK